MVTRTSSVPAASLASRSWTISRPPSRLRRSRASGRACSLPPRWPLCRASSSAGGSRPPRPFTGRSPTSASPSAPPWRPVFSCSAVPRRSWSINGVTFVVSALALARAFLRRRRRRGWNQLGPARALPPARRRRGTEGCRRPSGATDRADRHRGGALLQRARSTSPSCSSPGKSSVRGAPRSPSSWRCWGLGFIAGSLTGSSGGGLPHLKRRYLTGLAVMAPGDPRRRASRPGSRSGWSRSRPSGYGNGLVSDLRAPDHPAGGAGRRGRADLRGQGCPHRVGLRAGVRGRPAALIELLGVRTTLIVAGAGGVAAWATVTYLLRFVWTRSATGRSLPMGC